MGLISWIIIGGLAGWLASIITGAGERRGCLENIVLGIIGAIVGGWVMNFWGRHGATGLNFWSLGVAVFGAIIVLYIRQLFFKKSR